MSKTFQWLMFILLIIVVIQLAILHYKVDGIDWDVRQILGKVIQKCY